VPLNRLWREAQNDAWDARLPQGNDPMRTYIYLANDLHDRFEGEICNKPAESVLTINNRHGHVEKLPSIIAIEDHRYRRSIVISLSGQGISEITGFLRRSIRLIYRIEEKATVGGEYLEPVYRRVLSN
jgi:hypothetical protein